MPSITQGGFENFDGKRFEWRAKKVGVGLWQPQIRVGGEPWQDFGALKSDKDDAALSALQFANMQSKK